MYFSNDKFSRYIIKVNKLTQFIRSINKKVKLTNNTRFDLKVYRDILKPTTLTKINSNDHITHKLLFNDKKNLSNLEDVQFLAILEKYAKQKTLYLSTNKTVHIDELNHLQNECLSRIMSMDIEHLLFCGHILYNNPLYKDNLYNSFMNILNKRLSFHWDLLITKKPHYFSLISLLHNSTVVNDTHLFEKIEEFLANHITFFSSREVACVCHFFFSTNNRIKQTSTLKLLKNYTIDNFDEFSLGDLNNVFKVMRHANFNNIEYFTLISSDLPQKCAHPYSNFTQLSNTAFTYASLKIYQPSLLSAIAEIFCDKASNSIPPKTTTTTNGVLKETENTNLPQTLNSVSPISGKPQKDGNPLVISSINTSITNQKFSHLFSHTTTPFTHNPPRFKDICRLSWSLAQFSIHPPSLLITTLTQNLSQPEMAFKYPEVYVEGLLASCMFGHYPLAAFEVLFSKDFLQLKSRRPLEQDFQMLLLRCIEEIFIGKINYGELLTTHIPGLKGNLEYELKTRQGLLSLIEAIGDLVGDWSKFKVHFVLPCSRITDIEVQVDKKGRLMRMNRTNGNIENETDNSFGNENLIKMMLRQRNENNNKNSDKANNKNNDEANNNNNNSTGKSIIEQIWKKDIFQIFSVNVSYQDQLFSSAVKHGTRYLIKVMGNHQYPLNHHNLLNIHQIEIDILNKKGYHVYVVNPYKAFLLEKSDKKEKKKIIEDIFQNLKIKLK